MNATAMKQYPSLMKRGHQITLLTHVNTSMM